MNSIFDIKAEEKIERLERVLKDSKWRKVGKDYLSHKPMHIESVLNDSSRLYVLANRISFNCYKAVTYRTADRDGRVFP